MHLPRLAASKCRNVNATFGNFFVLLLCLVCASLASGCGAANLKGTKPDPVTVSPAPTSPVPGPPAGWPVAGHDLGNTRNQPAETAINNKNVSSLAVKWVFTTAASVSATPTFAGGVVYFPDWAGNLYAVNASTGQQIWQTTIPSYTGIANDKSRVSPAVYNNELIFGETLDAYGLHDGARVMAVDMTSGKLLWVTQVDTHPAAIITGSAVVSNGVVYQGVSSAEHEYALDPQYACCTFRGSMVALDAATGKILWKTYTIPDNNGAPNQYSGAAIWQPPVIDPLHNALYVGTGNNYTVPSNVETCQQNDPNATDCPSPDDHFDSALAMNLQTGAILWSRRFMGYDAWNVACVQAGNPSACPNPPGWDYDLGGSGGNLMGSTVGFGEKSGFYWVVNTVDGSLVWGTQVGPGGDLGGVEWGTATDGQRIYVPLTNNDHSNYVLANGQTITGSAWNALDPATGKILWQTPDPTQGQSFNFGAASVANGVVYVGAMDGHMYALDAATGKILWSYLSGGTVLGGPAIVNGVVYWGSGYARSGGAGNNKLYAFTLPAATP